jgi:hypothetical protein
VFFVESFGSMRSFLVLMKFSLSVSPPRAGPVIRFPRDRDLRSAKATRAERLEARPDFRADRLEIV